MSLVHSPSIVTNGLVLLLDAANKKSYPGSGTIVNNVISNITGIASSGVSFNTTYNGTLTFDGAAASIKFPSVSVSAGNITICCCYRVTGALNSFAPLVEQGGGRPFRCIINGSRLGFGNDNNTNNFYISPTSFTTINKWHHATFVFDGSYHIFVNGIEYALNVSTGQYGPYGTNELAIGYRPYTGAVSSLNGNIPYVQIYNRALSQDEIAQNFNSIRSRYGI